LLCKGLYFTAPYQVEIRDLQFKEPGPDEILVKTLFSAISSGSELLIYRGQAPCGLAADEILPALDGRLAFPLQYGYAAVGQVIEKGGNISQDWIGRTVFSFQPHRTHFTVSSNQAFILPPGIDPQTATFLPNMETAVNFVMDGHPLIGERVAVFGQGVVGLMTTALLAQFPLQDLLTVDAYPNRRTASMDAGATQSFDPTAVEALAQVRSESGVDLAYEISGSPAALDQAISVTGYGGRVVIGSWYGNKSAALDLGGAFHRSRIRLISSQVSTIEPSLTGRWSKTRRFDLAWAMIRQVKPERWISHKIPFQEAVRGYELLDQHPGQVLQVLLDYTG